MIQISKFYLLIALFILLPNFSYASASPSIDEAWEMLHQNKLKLAINTFANIIDQDDDDVAISQAHLALGIIHNKRGEFELSASHLIESFKISKDTAQFIAGIYFIRGPLDSKNLNHLKKWASENGYWQSLINDIISPTLLKNGETNSVISGNKDRGLISNWEWIGPFDNTSGLGFNKIYDPEKEINLKKNYVGKNENRVAWSPINSTSSTGWTFLSNHTSEVDGIFYFWSKIESDEEKEVYLGFGASGTFKVFLNNELVLADSIFRNTGADAYGNFVKLKKGSNTVLVKIGHEGSDERARNKHLSNFFLRIAEKDFGDIDDVEFSTKLEKPYEWHSASANYNLQNSEIANKIRVWYSQIKNPTWGQRLIYVNSILGVEKNEIAQNEILKLLSLKPNSSLFKIILSEAYFRNDKNVEAEQLIDQVSKITLEYEASWELALKKVLSKGESSKFVKFLEESPKHLANSLKTKFILFELYAKEERSAELIKLIKEFEKDQSDPKVAMLLANIYLSQGVIDGAINVVEEALNSNRNNTELYNALYSLYLKKGSFQDAVYVLNKQKKYIPESPAPYYQLANVYLMRNEFDKAIDEANILLEKIPHGVNVLNLIANIYLAKGDKETGLKYLQKIIDYTSNDFEAYDQIREAKNLKVLDDYAPLPKIDSVIKTLENWNEKSFETGAIPYYLKDVFKYPGGATKTRQSILVYLPTQEAINNWKEQSISFNSSFQNLKIEKAISINAEGAEVEADQSYNRLVYKSLSPGDYLYMQWVTYDFYTGEMANKIWGDMVFTTRNPHKLKSIRFITPKSDTIPYNVYSSEITAKKEFKDDYQISTLSRENFKDKLPDRYLPDHWKSLQEVNYSSFEKWQDVSEWYLGLSDNRVEISSEMKLLVDSLVKDLKTEEEKVESIHKWIVSTIRYSSQSFRQSGWTPQTSKMTMSSKVGDCKDMSVLGKALFEIAGIKSDIVLVSTERKRDLEQIMPSPNFNHAILSYMLNNERKFIDFTVENISYDGLPLSDQGAMALVVSKGNNELISLPVAKPEYSKMLRKINIELFENGDAYKKSEAIRTGIFAMSQRYTFRFLSEEKRIERMRDILGKDEKLISLDSLHFSDLNDLGDSLSYQYHFRVKEAVNINGTIGVANLSLPGLISAGDYPSESERDLPVDLINTYWANGISELQSEVKVPEKWGLLDLPAGKIIKNKWVDYKLEFVKTTQGLNISRKARYNFVDVIESKDYLEFKALLDEISKADNFQLVFKIP